MKELFSVQNFFEGINDGNIFIFSHQQCLSYSDTLFNVTDYQNIISAVPLNSKYAAVISDNSPETIFLVMALWNSGIIPVMINSRLNAAEVNELLSITPCRHILLNKNLNKNGFNLPVTEFPFDKSDLRTSNFRDINIDDSAVVLFTSGTTGKAKGVELTFRTFKESAKLQNKFLDQKEGDKWLLSLPIYHIGGFSILLRALINRTSIIIPESLKTDHISKSIKTFKPEYISLVGNQLNKMLNDDFYPGEQIKNILIGGGFTDESIIMKAIRSGWKISSVYGSTETASFIAAADYNTLKKYPYAAGRELSNGTVLILDEHRNFLPDNSEGEIAVKDVPLMKGYLNDEVGTKEKFYNGLYLTGDIGVKSSEGILSLQMRRTDLIVSGGENIDPREVEKVILSIDGINDAYVFAEPDLEWGQAAAAAVVVEKSISDDDLKSSLKKKLAGFKIPRKIYYVDRIPRNELGKVQLQSLKKILNGKGI